MSLDLVGISKRYPANPKPTITSFNLHANPGEFVVFLGPSGCGKSTLLRLVAGLIAPSSGQVLIGGKDVTRIEPARRDVAMVFQNYALFPHFTVRENLSFGMKLRKVSTSEIERLVREASAMLQIEDLLDKRPKELSGGQRQRVALGRAILRKPAVYLFDEPLSNLDAKLRAQLRTEIMQFHQREGKISIYVTHDQLEAMTMADHIVILDGGIAQQIGAPLEIYARPTNVFVADFLGSMNFFTGRVEGSRFLDADGLSQDLAPEILARYHGQLSGPVILGLRPEDIYRRTAPTAQGPSIFADVKMVETTGDSATLHCAFNRHMFKVRLKHQFLAARDKKIELGFDLSQAHFFKTTGENLLPTEASHA